MDGNDVEGVAGIELQSFSSWSKEQIAAELSRKDGISLVMEGDTGAPLLGWCCARIVGPEAELLKIAVRSDFRRGGYGAGLLKELCLNLFSLKVEALFLEVRSQNRAAVSFYLTHGFEKVGERPDYYRNPRDNGLIFRKELLHNGC